MTKYLDELKNKVEEIKKMGWVEAHRTGDTAIGKTFEDLLGKNEDNKSLPDYKDIEIKAQDKDTSSMLSLFTLSPKPSKINTKLRETYGVPCEENDKVKRLNTTISATTYNTHRGGYDFKLNVDEEKKRITIIIKEHETNKVVSTEAFWDFEDIKNSLEKKLKYIAYVNADKKIESGKVYFNYNQLYLITGLSMDNFIRAIKDGAIKADVRIGVYASGEKLGKTHDHGTGFRIQFKDLKKYADIYEIK